MVINAIGDRGITTIDELPPGRDEVDARRPDLSSDACHLDLLLAVAGVRVERGESER